MRNRASAIKVTNDKVSDASYDSESSYESEKNLEALEVTQKRVEEKVENTKSIDTLTSSRPASPAASAVVQEITTTSNKLNEQTLKKEEKTTT